MNAAVEAAPQQLTRLPSAGHHYYLTATNFLGEAATVEIIAQLTPAAIREGARCAVFLDARCSALRVDFPAMRPDEARAIAKALLSAADDADRIDRVPS
jgi:hypothetical protein